MAFFFVVLGFVLGADASSPVSPAEEAPYPVASLSLSEEMTTAFFSCCLSVLFFFMHMTVMGGVVFSWSVRSTDALFFFRWQMTGSVLLFLHFPLSPPRSCRAFFSGFFFG